MWAQGGTRDVLNKIIRFYFDAKEDYRLAAGRATVESVRTELDKMVDDRQAFHMQLQGVMAHYGVEPSDNGTAGADFKRDWERLRGAVAGHGFEHALQFADTSDGSALAEIATLLSRDLPADVREMLERHSDTLRQSRTRVHILRPDTATTA